MSEVTECVVCGVEPGEPHHTGCPAARQGETYIAKEGGTEPYPPRRSIRAEVEHFAQAQEYKLRRNDHKGGWEETSNEELFKKLRDEVDELEKAIAEGNVYEITMEAADIGNFAMMIAHNNTGGKP